MGERARRHCCDVGEGRLMARVRLKQLRSLGVILDSPEMENVVMGIADDVIGGVQDPNAEFMASLRSQSFHTKSARGVKRVVGQVGAAPWGASIEALRGPLARALGEADG